MYSPHKIHVYTHMYTYTQKIRLKYWTGLALNQGVTFYFQKVNCHTQQKILHKK